MLNVLANTETERPVPLYRLSSARVDFAEGFHPEERDELYCFRWMSRIGKLRFEPAAESRFLELLVFCQFFDLSQQLASSGSQASSLAPGWSRLSLRVLPRTREVALETSRLFPAGLHPGDPRELSVRVSSPWVHGDPERHRQVADQHANQIRNLGEMLQGKTLLESTPQSLGIDMYGICNVKPPCVYCEWDANKEAEGDNVEAPFTVETLRSWGELFSNASNLVNCSIGEPFLMKNIDELLDIYGDSGKNLEITSNGQVLTDRNIGKLLGRSIDLYISLDAATPETYRKLRNDSFERILGNIRRLVSAKGGRFGLPRIHLVFMPMRVNLHELDDFVALCADLEIDRLVLRPLNFSDMTDLDWQREGYHFEYQKELLTFEEQIRVSGRAAELCSRRGVWLADQMDFGGETVSELFAEAFEQGRQDARPEALTEPPAVALDAKPAAEPGDPVPVEDPLELSLGEQGKPACTEPWKSLYILRRGIYPCCYGGEPIAPMDGYRGVWNSSLLQGIRSDLAAGKFHQYCLESQACPIVRKAIGGRNLPFADRVILTATGIWHRLKKTTGTVLPPALVKPIKWLSVRLGKTLTDPGYLLRHLARIRFPRRTGRKD